MNDATTAAIKANDDDLLSPASKLSKKLCIRHSQASHFKTSGHVDELHTAICVSPNEMGNMKKQNGNRYKHSNTYKVISRDHNSPVKRKGRNMENKIFDSYKGDSLKSHDDLQHSMSATSSESNPANLLDCRTTTMIQANNSPKKQQKLTGIKHEHKMEPPVDIGNAGNTVEASTSTVTMVTYNNPAKAEMCSDSSESDWEAVEGKLSNFF